MWHSGNAVLVRQACFTIVSATLFQALGSLPQTSSIAMDRLHSAVSLILHAESLTTTELTFLQLLNDTEAGVRYQALCSLLQLGNPKIMDD